MQAAFDFIDEVQVKASGYQAEFGGSMGGVVNVVTRSGGNEFHGEVMGYYQGSAIRGKTRDVLRLKPDDTTQAEYFNYENFSNQDFSRLEGGFSLGGYIVKDKLWFFTSLLPVYRRTDRDVNFDEVAGAPADLVHARGHLDERLDQAVGRADQEHAPVGILRRQQQQVARRPAGRRPEHQLPRLDDHR